MFLGLDGFGEAYMYNYTDHLPNIRYLMKKGARTKHMRDRHPAVSAPNWGTMLTGLTPE
jgi:predicted AlkP superfamily phosphohydrolase/phosphomutase